MAAGQDWCPHCGAGARGSLGGSDWRTAAAVIGAVVVLVLGAAAAAYAALNQGGGRARVVTRTVAQVPAPTTTTPTSTGATPPATPGTPAKTPKAAKGLLGLGGTKPPKIPLTASTPQSTGTNGTSGTGTGATKPKKTSTPTSTTPASTTTGTSETGEESTQAAILLDTDAASTYNPYELPASTFGDPSLTVDDDPTTAWTAEVDPATAPKMAEGLLIDLKSKQKVSVLQLITSTPGMTVQVYGTDDHTAPTSITDPAWTPLSPPKVVKKKKLRISLRDSSKEFMFVTLWISSAPESAVGTPQAPGHVDVDELELFPTSSR